MKKIAVILCLMAHTVISVAQDSTTKANSQLFGGNISMHSTSLTFIKINEDWYIAEKVKELSRSDVNTLNDSLNNEMAKRVFVARVKLIRAEHDNPIGKLTDDIMCIITNFDLITQNKYRIKRDHSFAGEIEIWYDSQSIENYERWFERNSGLLRYDSSTGYLYVPQ